MTTPKLSFELKPSETYLTIILTGALAAESVGAFEKAVAPFLETPTYVVVNCEHLSDVPGPWIRALLGLNKQIKTLNKDIRYVFLTSGLTLKLRTQGVLQAFPVAPTLPSALIEFGLIKARALDVNFINPFLTATMTVLKIQASTDAKAGQIYKKAANEKFHGDISGVIGLVSEAFSGAVVISFPAGTFLKIMSRMLGETFTEINKEIEDGAGELTNIIFGQAKVALNERGYGIKTALPSVIAGKDHSVQSMTRGPRMVIPFTTDVGDFVVEVCLTE